MKSTHIIKAAEIFVFSVLGAAILATFWALGYDWKPDPAMSYSQKSVNETLDRIDAATEPAVKKQIDAGYAFLEERINQLRVAETAGAMFQNHLEFAIQRPAMNHWDQLRYNRQAMEVALRDADPFTRECFNKGADRYEAVVRAILEEKEK